MLERLTRAAREAQERRGAGYVAAAEIDWEVSVRAVLEAMREPTPEMIEAGCEARNLVAGTKWIDGVSEAVQSIERMLCERQWSAMIDAALNGERDGG